MMFVIRMGSDNLRVYCPSFRTCSHSKGDNLATSFPWTSSEGADSDVTNSLSRRRHRRFLSSVRLEFKSPAIGFQSNSHKFMLRDDVWGDAEVIDVTDRLREPAS